MEQIGVPCAFCKTNEKKSVKFGLGGRSNILLPRIRGSHPVPSLSLLSTERLCTTMYWGRGVTLLWNFLMMASLSLVVWIIFHVKHASKQATPPLVVTSLTFYFSLFCWESSAFSENVRLSHFCFCLCQEEEEAWKFASSSQQMHALQNIPKGGLLWWKGSHP